MRAVSTSIEIGFEAAVVCRMTRTGQAMPITKVEKGNKSDALLVLRHVSQSMAHYINQMRSEQAKHDVSPYL